MNTMKASRASVAFVVNIFVLTMLILGFHQNSMAQNQAVVDLFKPDMTKHMKDFMKASAKAEEFASRRSTAPLPYGTLTTIRLPQYERSTQFNVWTANNKIAGIQLVSHSGSRSQILGTNQGELATFALQEKEFLFGIVAHHNEDHVLGFTFVGMTFPEILPTNTKDFDEDQLIIRMGNFGGGENERTHGIEKILPGQYLNALIGCVSPEGIHAIGFRLRGSATHTTTIEHQCAEALPPLTNAHFDKANFEFLDKLEDFPYYIKYAGPWVRQDGEFKQVLTGNKKIDGGNDTKAGTYITPEVVHISFPTGDGGVGIPIAHRRIEIRYDHDPQWSTWQHMVWKDGERDSSMSLQFGSPESGTTHFTQVGHRIEMTIIGPNNATHGPLYGTYVRAKLADGKTYTVKKQLFGVNEKKQDQEGLFELSANVVGYDFLRSGYDGAEMSPMNIQKGMKSRYQIFDKFDQGEYTISYQLNKAVADGYRAFLYGLGSTEYSESAVSSASEVQKTFGYSFGGSGGAKGTSLGINYSKEESKGMSNSATSMMAFGIARFLKFALVLDKANSRFTSDFNTDVREVINKRMTADQLVSKYGTHYPNAITYGGMAVATNAFSQSEYARWATKSYSIGGSGGAKGVSVSGEYHENESSKDNNMTSFKQSDFKSKGGVGSWNENGFSVGDAVVPVLYDMRPISDLASPFFLTDLSLFRMDAIMDARTRIDMAIDTHFNKFQPLETESTMPVIYRVTFTDLRCTDGGDDGPRNEIVVSGSWKVNYYDSQGSHTQTLFDSASDVKIACDGTIHDPLNKTLTLWFSPQEIKNMVNRYVMSFELDMVEKDDNFINMNDGMKGGFDTLWFAAEFPKEFTLVNQELPKHTASTAETKDEPTIKINYTIERLE